MKLIDLVYHTIKSCEWLDREISKEKIEDGSYLTDVDLSTFVVNVYTTLNQAFSLVYTLNKISPVVISLDLSEDNSYNLGNDILEVFNVYQNIFGRNNRYKGYVNLYFKNGSSDGEFFVKNRNNNALNFEVIRQFPTFDSTYNDVDLKSYGINDQVAYICSKYACALLYSGIDQNVAYLRENVAVSIMNTLPDYANYNFHNQQFVEDIYNA